MNLENLVRARHPLAKGWVVLSEVSNDHASRRADLVAISCWADPFAVAYELKASRADWLREMDDPTKRTWAEKTCRLRWFLTEPGCAKREELPAGWGLVEVIGEGENRRLRRLVAAPAHTVERLPKWLCRSLLRGAEARQSVIVERDALRALQNGDHLRQEQATLAEARVELARVKAETTVEKGSVESFWNGLATLAGEEAWRRSYAPARRDWDLGELWALLRRRAAAGVQEQAEIAARACQALVVAAQATCDAPESPISEEMM